MELAYSTISQMPTSKEEIASFVSKIKSELEGGYIDPLKALKDIKCIQKSLESIIEIVQPLAVEEAQKYGSKFFDAMGVKFEIKEVGVKYNYDNCSDPIYQAFKAKQNEASENVKSREAFLKSIKDSEIIVDPDTGEQCTIYPPVKSSTTSVVVTIK